MLDILFKQKNTRKKHNKQVAKELYRCALLNVRNRYFYEECGVPDTFDGRFDLLLLHIFMILNHLMKHEDCEALSQDIFDITFRDMDQTLREMGVGDVGVPKHMKRMMKAFNGRMHSYQLALDPDSLSGKEIEGLRESSLEEAIKRNVYGIDEHGSEIEEKVLKLCQFVEYNLEQNVDFNVAKLKEGKACFINKKNCPEELKRVG